MSITLTYKVNSRLAVKVEEENQKRAIAKIGFFSELPDKCPRCDASYGLSHRESEGYHFFEAQCENGHISQFGQHKKGDTLFYKSKEKWKTIEERTGHTPKEANNDSRPTQSHPQWEDKQQEQAPVESEDDLPF